MACEMMYTFPVDAFEPDAETPESSRDLTQHTKQAVKEACATCCSPN